MEIIFKKFKREIFVLLLLMATSTILELSFLSYISDILKGNVDSEVIYYVIVIFFSKITLQILLSYYQPFFAFSVLRYLSFSVYSKSTDFFKSEVPLSTVIRNSTTESDHAVMGFVLPLISLAVDIVMAVAITWILIIEIGVILVYILLIGLLLLLLVSYFSTIFLNKLGKVRQENEDLRLKEVKTLYDLSAEIKFIGNREHFHQNYKKYLNLITRSGKLTTFFQQLPKNAIEIIGVLIFGSLYFFIENDPELLTVSFGLLAVSATRLVPAVSRIFTAVYTLSYSYPAYYLIVNSIKPNSPNKKCTQSTPRVTINSDNLTILCDTNSNLFSSSFEIKVLKNKINVITGSSGSGKTTLLTIVSQLLLDFGKLQDDKRVFVSYMPQNSKLFEGTLIDNLILSDGSVSSSYNLTDIKQIFSLLKIEYLLNRRGSVKYKIMDDAKNLSGGEARRICLARHLLSKPLILLLDEPTSGLDKQNEYQLFSLLKKISANTTLLIVSHGEDLIQGADNLIELDKRGGVY